MKGAGKNRKQGGPRASEEAHVTSSIIAASNLHLSAILMRFKKIYNKKVCLWVSLGAVHPVCTAWISKVSCICLRWRFMLLDCTCTFGEFYYLWFYKYVSMLTPKIKGLLEGWKIHMREFRLHFLLSLLRLNVTNYEEAWRLWIFSPSLNFFFFYISRTFILLKYLHSRN